VSTTSKDVPNGPSLPEGTIAAYDRLTFAIGGAHLHYDSVRNQTTFDANVAGLYQRRIERARLAWGIDAAANVVTGLVNPDGAGISRAVIADARVGGEARFYAGQVFGIGQIAVGSGTTYISNDMGLKDVSTIADFQVAIGGGYGRILDVGAALRVRRIAAVLEHAKALGRPIDQSLQRRLQLAWWALRGERSMHRVLTATVAILRDAGVLLGEPDAGLAYELLAVLEDIQLDRRTSGLDAYVAVSESYLLREDGDPDDGRYEQVLARVAYGKQLPGLTSDITGSAYGRLRVLAPDGERSPWAAGAAARWRKFTYGDHYDPIGAIDIGAFAAVSDDDVDGVDVGFSVGGDIGFSLVFNRVSVLRLSGNASFDGGELIVGAALEASYGLADGSVSSLP
jgi:hypothetical protein